MARQDPAEAGAQSRTFIEAIRQTIRRLHDSSRTEEAYVHWTRAFIAFHGGRHPRTLGAPDATAFLNHLAVDRRVSASTQDQALCAILFLYRRVLDLDLPQLLDLERARRPHHLPAVRSHREVLVRTDQVLVRSDRSLNQRASPAGAPDGPPRRPP